MLSKPIKRDSAGSKDFYNLNRYDRPRTKEGNFIALALQMRIENIQRLQLAQYLTASQMALRLELQYPASDGQQFTCFLHAQSHQCICKGNGLLVYVYPFAWEAEEQNVPSFCSWG